MKGSLPSVDEQKNTMPCPHVPSPFFSFQPVKQFMRAEHKFTCLDVGHINSMVQSSYSGNSKAIEARNEALNEAPDGNGNSAVSLCLVSHEAGLMYHQAGHFSRPTSATGRIIPIIWMFFLGTNHPPGRWEMLNRMSS